MTSVPLDSPPKRPTIGFAGGPRKHGAVLAVLKGGWLSGLVTDEACARDALADGERAVPRAKARGAHARA